MPSFSLPSISPRGAGTLADGVQNGAGMLQAIKEIPVRLQTMRKRHLLFLILSASGLASALLFFLYKRRSDLALKRAKSRSAVSAPPEGRRYRSDKPVGQVDPRHTSSVASTTSTARRQLSREERLSLRSRRGGGGTENRRISRTNSFDRASISSVRSTRNTVEDSVQLLGELNMSHYSDVLNNFQNELEAALFQYANRKHTSSGAVVGSVRTSGASGVGQQVAVSEGARAAVAPTLGSTPVNSKELISKLQKLLDLASELHQKSDLERSRDSVTDMEGPIIEEDAAEVEETLAQLGLRRRSTNYLDNDDSELDDNSSTLSFRSVEQEFPSTSFASDTAAKLPSQLISKFPFINPNVNTPGGGGTGGGVTPDASSLLPNGTPVGMGGASGEHPNRMSSSPKPFPQYGSGSVGAGSNITNRSSGASSMSVVDDSFSYHSASVSGRLSSEDNERFGGGHESVNGGVQGVSNRTSLISHPSSDPSVNTTMTYQTAQGFNTYSVTSPMSDPFLSAMGTPSNHEVAASNLLLYEQGLNAVNDDLVPCRVLRAELLNLGSDSEFLAKLFGIRRALTLIFKDSSNRDFLKSAGKRVVADFLLSCNHSPTEFQIAFDEIIRFCDDEDNWPVIDDELSNRGVVDMNFFDIVIDFIFLDAFDDLESPPASIVNVLQNRWLSQSFKETALRTAVWSVLKAKRARLRHPDAFINRFYAISEVMSPLFAYGFLGPPGDLQDLCLFFKGEVLDFVRKMFDQSQCRYSSEPDLAEDILALARTKVAIITQRFSEIIPPAAT
ncbi:uncharacterized protein LOC142336035 isoform X2 [Convolutriloba macropyga]|uniref:uncharacterized protein LOC142336035 isoform X2 n=1 Tax=Convolutriloba macropyga TaxID=536237 RepID=UPI003F526E11